MNQENQIQEQKMQYAPQTYPQYYEDEISLLDIWLVLVKRKAVILKVFVFFVVLAIALFFIKKDKYEFSTTIEIGQIISEDNGYEFYNLVEPLDSVKAKLENSYIPAAEAQYFLGNPDKSSFKLSIEAPKNSQMLILKSKGKEDDSDRHLNVHNAAVIPLLNDSNRKVDSSRSRLQQQLAEAKQELQRLQSPVVERLLQSAHDQKINKATDSFDRLSSDVYWQPKIKQLESSISQSKINLQDAINKGVSLKAQRQRLDALEDLLLKQLEGLNDQIKEARATRTKAVSVATDETKAMTILLLDSEMQRLVTRQSKLEERIFIDHKNKVQQLENEISANKDEQQKLRIIVLESEAELVKANADRSSQIRLQKPKLAVLEDEKIQALALHKQKIAKQKQKIKTLESSINSITDSHIIVPFLQSLEPKGLTSKVLFIIVVFLGFIFAVITAFIAEFLAKAKEKMREQGIA